LSIPDKKIPTTIWKKEKIKFTGQIDTERSAGKGKDASSHQIKNLSQRL
jgi:hypothetical protein